MIVLRAGTATSHTRCGDSCLTSQQCTDSGFVGTHVTFHRPSTEETGSGSLEAGVRVGGSTFVKLFQN